MYAQPIDEPTQQMEPSLACYELLLNWQTFLPSGKGARKSSGPYFLPRLVQNREVEPDGRKDRSEE